MMRIRGSFAQALVLLAGMLAAACDGAGEQAPAAEIFTLQSASRLEAPVTGLEAELVFRTNCAWTLDVPDDWVQVDVRSGSPQSETQHYTLHVTVSPNDEGSRMSTLTFAYGTKGAMARVFVTQSSLRFVSETKVYEDMLFSTCPAAEKGNVQQGFDFSADRSTMYFTQVSGGYKNVVSWTPRVPCTTSTALPTTKMTLLYFSHSNNIRYEHTTDGDFLWLANYGTRDAEDKYTNPQILSRIRLESGKTLRNTEVSDNYYFGTKTLHASFDLDNDQLAIFSQSDGYTVNIYRLSEVLATPVSDVTLKYELTYGGGVSKIAPDPQWTGRPVVKAHDCTRLTPLYSFVYNYPKAGRSWQTYCIHDGKAYFFLFYSKAGNGLVYQSVIDIIGFDGKVIKSDILQPFADDMEGLSRLGYTDAATAYMENEGIIIRDGVLYLLYTAKNQAGFRRPVIFQLDPNSL